MTNITIKQAIRESEQVARLRSGEEMIPPPNYDIALCLYERNEDGSDADTPLMCFARPQDFATNPYMKYQRFGVLAQHHGEDGAVYVTQTLVHLYWDGSQDADDVCRLVVNNFQPMQGLWVSTAPSDPLGEDDFWDHDELGDPPNGYWGEADSFQPFDNFAREPYKRVEFGSGGRS